MLFSTAIIKTEYLPPISTFWAMLNVGEIYLEECETYQKKSTRNRSKIVGVNGIEVLSVPLLKGKNNNMPIKNVHIAYTEDWQSKHIQSIRSAYGNAPYFEYYINDICDLINAGYDTLYELNSSLLDYFIQVLQLELDIKKTIVYSKNYPSTHLDIRNLKFNNLTLDHYEPKRYNQVFEEKHDFISGVSILDLLMCKGPESIFYI